MKLERSYLLAAAAVMLLFMGAPETALAAATERIVYQPSTDSCTSSAVVPLKECYTTIKSAIDAALVAEGDHITIKPGTYTTEPLTLSTNVSISGTETARCIISGGGSGPIITINGATSISIRKLTFINATTGIKVTNSTSVNITNNVFRVGASGTAVSVEGTSTVNITNNTLYQNLIGIAFVTGTTLDIENNIFYGNGAGSTAISSSASCVHQYNCFFNITAGQTDTVGIVTTDPKFVDPAAGDAGDFHLQEGSPCIDVGSETYGADIIDLSTADIGAYGGPNADTIPFQVTVSAPSVSGTDPYTVDFDWSENLCYLVTNTAPLKRGGYKIYYNLNQPGPPYSGTTASTGVTEGDSPINVFYTTLGTLSGLSAASSPATPSILSVDFANQTLKLKWTPITGAVSYTIYYIDNDASTPMEQSVPVPGNTSSYDLTGLVNLHDYSLAVTAWAQNIIYFAVTAYDSTTQTKEPGIQHESAYSQSQPQYAYIGPAAESAKVYDTNTYYPEPITPNPNLLNKGCFIATAAYGYYSAPQVQTLREFRDRYLMTNAPGRAFVRWYYQHGPVGAQFINEHPWLKPFVRTALMPAVGGAMFITRTSMITKTLTLFMFVLFVTYLIRRTRRSAEICGKIIKREEKP